MCNNDTTSTELNERECAFWEIFINITFLTAFLILCCSLVIFALLINGYLFYLSLKHRYPRHPQNIILANLALCDFAITITLMVHLLPRVVHRKTAMLSKWCVSFLTTFASFMVACQLTWTLLAGLRYIYICHGIHYTRIVRTRYIRWALAGIWAIVLAFNTYHLMLIHYRLDFAARPLDTLVCDPLTTNKLLSPTDSWLIRVPPLCAVLFSILSIFTCYIFIYRAALKVSADLRQSSLKAARHVGCYLAMFLVQMLPAFWCMAIIALDEIFPNNRIYPRCQILMLILILISPSANALTAIYCNKDFRREMLCFLKARAPQRVVEEMGTQPQIPGQN